VGYVIRELQIKTMTRLLCTPVRRLEIQDTDHVKRRKDVEQWESHLVLEWRWMAVYYPNRHTLTTTASHNTPWYLPPKNQEFISTEKPVHMFIESLLIIFKV
jgi:hypothetical protein